MVDRRASYINARVQDPFRELKAEDTYQLPNACLLLVR